MPKKITVEGARLTLELLLWRAYGARGNTGPMLTASLALNPGLARLGAVLPIGRTVLLADLPPRTPAVRRADVVDIFGE